MVTVRPERFVAGGDALAKADDGRVVFVRGALPGELVTVELTEQKRDWSRGDVVAVVEPSADRVIPPCQYRRAGCGGCDWQHLGVPTQLSAKAAILAEAMRRTGGLDDAVIIEGPSAPSRAYRTSVRVVGSPSGRAGFRRERSNATVEVDVCMVAHPALFDVLRDVTIDPDVELTVRVSEATGQMTAMWDSRKGDVKGLPDTVQTGSQRGAVRGRRRPPVQGVGRIVLPVGAGGGGAARRRGPPRGPGDRRSGARGRRVRRRRVVRPRRRAGDEPDDEHRDVAFVRPGRLGEPRRTGGDDRAQ